MWICSVLCKSVSSCTILDSLMLAVSEHGPLLRNFSLDYVIPCACRSFGSALSKISSGPSDGSDHEMGASVMLNIILHFCKVSAMSKNEEEEEMMAVRCTTQDHMKVVRTSANVGFLDV
ncbi:hypothetical protein Y1Q_0010306 [Alligator mississippiensis]|uniref:Uncharacterized protein n=1 Tax=Alligator mississippiensis TaxID=8496 RepID=A0A151NM18_ALLMI|nr:hypothetical protein Y1Q_0010306 [Alligator mississippiensis]